MLEIRGVSKYFSGGGSEKVTALSDINLTFQENSYNVVVGGNGSGKSTLLNLIAGTLSCDQGSILLNYRPIHKKADYKRAMWVSRIFQEPSAGTAPDLSLVENFRLAALRKKRKGLRVGIDRAFRVEVAERLKKLDLGLEKKLDSSVSQLSGGQRQAATLLMATYEAPDVLLMDEPSAALDPKSAQIVMQLADDIVKELKPIAILVTHQMAEAVKYGDRLLQFRYGRVVKDLDSMEKSELKATDLLNWFQEDI
jgi:putative tryptophan/tyrosine transport system ATP-binding protein